MYYTVYKITNKINNKFYIGKHQTKNLEDNYMGSGKLIVRAIEKYGVNNFIKEILFIFDNENDMNNKEKELVVLIENSYNLCPGGQGGFGYINSNGLNAKGTQQIIKIAKQRHDYLKEHPNSKLMLSLKKRVHIARIKALLKIKEKYPQGTFKGKKHSEKTKKKLSEIDRTGIKNSQYGTFWITDGKLNKKCKEIRNIPEGWYRGRTHIK